MRRSSIKALMAAKLTRDAYRKLIDAHIDWLESITAPTLARVHIVEILRESEQFYYTKARKS